MDPLSSIIEREEAAEIAALIDSLSPRYADIVWVHYGFAGEPKDGRALAREAGLSQSRIWQILQKSLERMRWKLYRDRSALFDKYPAGRKLRREIVDRRQAEQDEKRLEKERQQKEWYEAYLWRRLDLEWVEAFRPHRSELAREELEQQLDERIARAQQVAEEWYRNQRVMSGGNGFFVGPVTSEG